MADILTKKDKEQTHKLLINYSFIIRNSYGMLLSLSYEKTSINPKIAIARKYTSKLKCSHHSNPIR